MLTEGGQVTDQPSSWHLFNRQFLPPPLSLAGFGFLIGKSVPKPTLSY